MSNLFAHDFCIWQTLEVSFMITIQNRATIKSNRYYDNYIKMNKYFIEKYYSHTILYFWNARFLKDLYKFVLWKCKISKRFIDNIVFQMTSLVDTTKLFLTSTCIKSFLKWRMQSRSWLVWSAMTLSDKIPCRNWGLNSF